MLDSWRAAPKEADQEVSARVEAERRLLEKPRPQAQATESYAPLRGLDLRVPEELLRPGPAIDIGKPRRDEILDTPDAEFLSMVEDERVVLDDLDGALQFQPQGRY